MKRLLLVAATSLCLTGAALPAAASAQTVELGQTKSPLVAPSCPTTVTPANCTIILTRSTALETIRDGTNYPTTATQAGYIVAFTVGLSQLSTNATTAHNEVASLDHTYGGTTQAAIAVLQPVGKAKYHTWQLVAVSPIVHLQPYLGSVTQFPLTTALPIAKGDTVALSVPTWAPVLSIGLSATGYAYRQSRRANCGNPAGINQAMFTLQASNIFGCDYTGTRVEYSATEITTPVPPKTQVHAPIIRRRLGVSGSHPARRTHRSHTSKHTGSAGL
jgi:hypothetical protein